MPIRKQTTFMSTSVIDKKQMHYLFGRQMTLERGGGVSSTSSFKKNNKIEDFYFEPTIS